MPDAVAQRTAARLIISHMNATATLAPWKHNNCNPGPPSQALRRFPGAHTNNSFPHLDALKFEYRREVVVSCITTSFRAYSVPPGKAGKLRRCGYEESSGTLPRTGSRDAAKLRASPLRHSTLRTSPLRRATLPGQRCESRRFSQLPDNNGARWGAQTFDPTRHSHY